ncbi:S-methyl-5-thioribose kinase [Zobellella maritima]|uniref:S-methyl-5-thioribose kinase n=1 Tax=Zobellella maritima TaxID=2059725 RepID=UPI000E30ACDF|nr:S-methyl-5-thioribose kinase [Zobellella maritima]
MSRYRIFNTQDAIEYAREFGHSFDADSRLSAEEIGDGNLNLVFKIHEEGTDRRLIVKQALPYVRCVGESWPLTLDRARIEAEVLLRHGEFCPEHTVAVLHHDAELAIMVLEDLSHCQVWRTGLIAGKTYPKATAQLGEYLAQTLYHTSDFHQSTQAKKADVARFINPEMCEITEDVFFTDPYRDHERNNINPDIRADAERLWADRPLKARVATLKHAFLTRAEALLHGDVHSGSIFVDEDTLKVFDAEFGYYGPMGFDVGSAIGNLLLNFCGQPGLRTPEQAPGAQDARIQDVLILWQTFSRRFAALAADNRDQALAEPGYLDAFLGQVWRDSLGFAGTELIRRTIGIAHVADLDGIADAAVRARCQRTALALGRDLILSADSLHDSQALVNLLTSYR